MKKRNNIVMEGDESGINKIRTPVCVCVSVCVSDRHFNQKRFVLETLPSYH